MKNIELVYREILYKTLEKKEMFLTQSELSKKLDLSLSIVNSGVRRLSMIGAVKIVPRGFKVIDVKKILYLWASIRNLEKDIIFRVRIEISVREIERVMPNVVFTGYSAYKLIFNDVPADYSEIYVYADEKELEIIKKRISKFKTSQNNPNFFILKKDNLIDLYNKIPLANIFVDLWNLKEWYAKDFILNFEKNLGV